MDHLGNMGVSHALSVGLPAYNALVSNQQTATKSIRCPVNPMGTHPLCSSTHSVHSSNGHSIDAQKCELREWIERVGKPAEAKVLDLESKFEALQIEHGRAELELAQLRSELRRRGDERDELQLKVDELRSDNKELTEKVENERMVHRDTARTLEEYAAKETEIEVLQNENEKLREQLAALKRENANLGDHNERFKERHLQISQQRDSEKASYGAIAVEVHEHEDMIHKLRGELQDARDMVADREREIERFRQKFQLNDLILHSDTADIVAKQRRKSKSVHLKALHTLTLGDLDPLRSLSAADSVTSNASVSAVGVVSPTEEHTDFHIEGVGVIQSGCDYVAEELMMATMSPLAEHHSTQFDGDGHGNGNGEQREILMLRARVLAMEKELEKERAQRMAHSEMMDTKEAVKGKEDEFEYVKTPLVERKRAGRRRRRRRGMVMDDQEYSCF